MICISFFWLRLNNDIVFKAIVLEHDWYKKLPGSRVVSQLQVPGLWQDLKVWCLNHVSIINIKAYGDI